MIMERGAFLWLFVWTIQLRCDVADVAHDGPRGNRAFSDLAHARCTRDGQAAPCLDVESCERSGAAIASNKSLVVVFHDCHSPLRKNGRIERALVANAAVAARDGFDYAWAVPPVALRKNDFPEAWFGSKGVAVMELPLPWLVPPNLSAGVPVESGGCCGAREFLKFVPMGYDEYDAIMVVDNDYDLDDFGKFGPLFDCAADGHVITTRAPMSMVNGALLVVPPSRALRDALLDALSTATVDYTGWNKTPWGPLHHKWDPRVQGFFYWFFYQQYDALADRRWRPAQVDPCVWNVQQHLVPMCRAELCGNRSLGSGHVDGLRKYRKGLC